MLQLRGPTYDTMSVSFGALAGEGFFNSACAGTPTTSASQFTEGHFFASIRVLTNLNALPSPEAQTLWLADNLEVEYWRGDETIVYRVKRVLGEGSYGTVFRVECDPSVTAYPTALAVKWMACAAFDELRAIRIVNDMVQDNVEKRTDFIPAVAVFGTNCSHVNLLSTDTVETYTGRYDFSSVDHYQGLVVMQCAEGDLRTYWRGVTQDAASREELTLGALKVLSAVVRCLSGLYDATKCVFMDAKTENFLVTCEGGQMNAVLADYGGISNESDTGLRGGITYAVPDSLRKSEDDVTGSPSSTPVFGGVVPSQCNAVYTMLPLLLDLLGDNKQITVDLNWSSTQNRARQACVTAMNKYFGTQAGKVVEWLAVGGLKVGGVQLTFAGLKVELDTVLNAPRKMQLRDRSKLKEPTKRLRYV